MSKYLNEAGLAYYDIKQKERLAQKADVSALPTKLSQLTNDKGFVTSADVPAVPDWAKEATKPTYTAEEVGAIPATDAASLATKSEIPMVPSWAMEGTKPTYTPEEVGAIPASYAASLATKSEIPMVPSWAMEGTKPIYTAAEVGAIPAADADTFAKKSDLTSVYKYKGSVATVAELPASDNTVGDVWNVEATDMNYGWTGTAWDPLGQMFSIDSITNAEIDTILSA